MKRAIILVLICTLTALSVHGQSIRVSGNVKTLVAQNVASSNTYVRFTPAHSGAFPELIGHNLIVSDFEDLPVDSERNINGQITGYGRIWPAGTTYQVCVLNNGLKFRCANYLITGGLYPDAFNLNTAQPITSVVTTPNQVARPRIYPYTRTMPSTTWVISHNFNDPNAEVDCSDSTGTTIVRDKIVRTDANDITVYFASAQTGSCNVLSPGLLIIGSESSATTATNQNGPGEISRSVSGNATFTGINVQSLNGIQYADRFSGATADVQINAAIAALPPQGGTVDARGLAGTQTIASTVTLGNAKGQIVTLLMDRGHTYFQCTITSGAPCWQIYPGSSMTAFGPGAGVGSSGLGVVNGAKISNVIKAINNLTNRPLLDNIYIQGNPNATVTDSAANLSCILDGTSVNNLNIGGFPNTTLLKITNTTGCLGLGPANFNNLTLDCTSYPGCLPLVIDGSSIAIGIGSLNFFGGSFTHPGSGGLAIVSLLNDSTGSSIQGVNFYGPQLESHSTSDIGFLCSGCRNVHIDGLIATNDGTHGLDIVRISNATANPGAVNIDNVSNLGGWTNIINNQITSNIYKGAYISHYTYGSNVAPAKQNVWEDSTGVEAVIDLTGGVQNKILNVTGSGKAFKWKLSDQGTCTMSAGTCTAQGFASTYSVAPQCFATWTGTGTLTGQIKVPTTTSTVTPSSSTSTDTAQVNWACFGN
jgi:hypothetical protein